MEITAQLVKDLREKTGAGMMDCKKALKESNGDFEKAIEYLRTKSLAVVAKRASRQASSGQVGSYIHFNGSIGVLIEVNCETDFVANTDEFKVLVNDIAMHIAASNPLYLKREDVNEDVLIKEKEIYRQQALESGKPANIVDKIAEGRVEKYYQENCLLEQKFVKIPELSILEYINEKVGKIGEKIEVRRFTRFEIGA